MRKLILIILMTISIGSCQERTKKDVESKSKIPMNSEITAKAEIDFKSNPIAEEYRTVITEKYNELEVNFANYYVIIT